MKEIIEKNSKVIIRFLNDGISRVIINDAKTYNSLSFDTLKSLVKGKEVHSLIKGVIEDL